MSMEREQRLYPDRPFVGVGAVVWDGQHILLERRGQPPAAGSWALPGGLIELGETAEDALRREIMEECGIEIEVGPVLGLFQPIQWDPGGAVKYHFVVVDFLAHYVSGELRAGDDAAAVLWVPPADLPQYELTEIGRQMIAQALDLVHEKSG